MTSKLAKAVVAATMAGTAMLALANDVPGADSATEANSTSSLACGTTSKHEVKNADTGEILQTLQIHTVCAVAPTKDGGVAGVKLNLPTLPLEGGALARFNRVAQVYANYVAAITVPKYTTSEVYDGIDDRDSNFVRDMSSNAGFVKKYITQDSHTKISLWDANNDFIGSASVLTPEEAKTQPVVDVKREGVYPHLRTDYDF